MRVCLLTGGGDAPGVNAIIRGFVHAAYRDSIDVVGCRYGFEGLLDSSGFAPLGVDDVRGILARGGSILGCSTRENPFFVPFEGGTRDFGPAIVDRLRSARIDALVLIGGDGTMLAAERFIGLGMPCVGVPKTIDDDLAETDRTTGFDTAVEHATRAIDALHSTAEAHARVMLVEVMGRGSGAIALHAGLAGGADVILIPELPYRVDRVVAKIRERESLGRRFSIVVVAEGARPVDGDAAAIDHERPGHLPRLGGAGARILRALEAANLGHEVRLTVLGHLLRGGTPTATDRVLGTMVGTHAAKLCRDRQYNRRVVAHDGRVASVPLGAGRPLHKVVDLGSAVVRSALCVGIELGDRVEAAS